MKTVLELKNEYINQGIYFAPEYEQKNGILENFKFNNQTLNDEQSLQLIEILRISQILNEKFFVADLLYYYENIDEKFFEPLIQNAINYDDPSFNRIFLIPAINNFGLTRVIANLKNKKENCNELQEQNIEKLEYWINIYKQEN